MDPKLVLEFFATLLLLEHGFDENGRLLSEKSPEEGKADEE